MNRDFVTGVTGRDGSCLRERLLVRDSAVHGPAHRPDALPAGNGRHLVADSAILDKRLFLHIGASGEAAQPRRIISQARHPIKARRMLGWQNTVPFAKMVGRLVESELRNLA